MAGNLTAIAFAQTLREKGAPGVCVVTEALQS